MWTAGLPSVTTGAGCGTGLGILAVSDDSSLSSPLSSSSEDISSSEWAVIVEAMLSDTETERLLSP